MCVEITDNSSLVKEEMETVVLRALEKCGLTAEGYSKMLCHVDTGNLRNSITHQVQPSETAVYIGSASEYAAYVEKVQQVCGFSTPVQEEVDEAKN